MKLKQLFTDDDAVSPVIGVILMVAITVILAAVIGAFVLDIGGSQQQVPQASFDAEQDGSGDGSTITFSHQGGDSIKAGNLEIVTDGDSADYGTMPITTPFESASSDDVSSGSTQEVNVDSDDAIGDTLSIVWESDDGSQSQTLYDYEVQ